MRALLLLVAGCSFEHGVITTGDGGGSDAPIDAEIDAPPDALDANCFGKNPFVVCLQTIPTTEVTLPDTINTGNSGSGNCTSVGGAIGMVTGVEACVFAGTNIAASGTIVGVFGPRPLVLVATDTITVTTTNFDIRSRTSGTPSDGPNANPVQCTVDATINGTGAMNGAGGGAGGTFGGKGSNGGNGGNGNAAGGIAKDPPATFNVLRGGCRGGSGPGANGTANGGSGGGAVYLVARNAIMVNGVINASGAGGVGGSGSRGGGGGGGSGGMIVFHAPTLSFGVAARVFANGGGGAGGAGNTLADAGDGGDAITADTAAAAGVASASEGTSGGTGAFKSTPAGAVTQAQQGAGGGGGGVGVIRILSGQSVAPINVSPTPILN